MVPNLLLAYRNKIDSYIGLVSRDLGKVARFDNLIVYILYGVSYLHNLLTYR
jgi:hypothetical protein